MSKEAHDEPSPWKTLSSRIAYQTSSLTVREDKVITPGGSEGVYSIVESKPGVLVIARTDSGGIYLIESFRYPLQAWQWEVPGGGIDPGETHPSRQPNKSWERNLAYGPTHGEQLGDMYPSNNGPLNDHNFIFLARGLHVAEEHHETGEAIRPPKLVPWPEVLNMVRRGELTDGQSLGALLHYSLWQQGSRPAS